MTHLENIATPNHFSSCTFFSPPLTSTTATTPLYVVVNFNYFFFFFVCGLINFFVRRLQCRVTICGGCLYTLSTPSKLSPTLQTSVMWGPREGKEEVSNFVERLVLSVVRRDWCGGRSYVRIIYTFFFKR